MANTCSICNAPVATHAKGDIIVTMIDGRVVTLPDYLKIRAQEKTAETPTPRGSMELPAKYDALPPTERRLVREEYIKLQGGLCCHCGEDLKGPPRQDIAEKATNRRLFPDNFFKYPVHLHHDHDTGLTIGAIHSKCNAVLWEYHGE